MARTWHQERRCLHNVQELGDNSSDDEISHLTALLLSIMPCFARRRSWCRTEFLSHCVRHLRSGIAIVLAIPARAGSRGRHCRAFFFGLMFMILNLSVPARLGADRLGDFLSNRDSNDGDRIVGRTMGIV